MASCWPSCYSPDCLSLAIGLLNAAIGLLNAPRIIMEVENDGKWPHMSLYEYVVNFTCTLIPGRKNQQEKLISQMDANALSEQFMGSTLAFACLQASSDTWRMSSTSHVNTSGALKLPLFAHGLLQAKLTLSASTDVNSRRRFHSWGRRMPLEMARLVGTRRPPNRRPPCECRSFGANRIHARSLHRPKSRTSASV